MQLDSDLIRNGLSCELSLIQWSPGFESELVARLTGTPEESFIGLLFLWGSLAFLEARPLTREGLVPTDYSQDDGWSSLDFLGHLRWRADRLGLELSVLRGRQVSTQLFLDRNGLFSVKTEGRGDSALWWFHTLRS